MPSFSIAFRATPANRACCSFTMLFCTHIARSGSKFVMSILKSIFGYWCVKFAVPFTAIEVSSIFVSLRMMLRISFVCFTSAVKDSMCIGFSQWGILADIFRAFISIGIPMKGRLSAVIFSMVIFSDAVSSSCIGKDSFIVKGKPDTFGGVRLDFVMIG